jgi:hypothetical protein
MPGFDCLSSLAALLNELCFGEILLGLGRFWMRCFFFGILTVRKAVSSGGCDTSCEY